ncbi:class I SAM-dependent methyltransferase [Sphingobium lactosutens]|uniref:class I SAM-dependent methyltransferase n=1 Tax=Sphingobium lactosutens TaxID=522773 RepID=UPI0015BEFFC6|nr:class I SAM-dependent methyltransferase [Sphingobium lactosutens]NWK98185.1 class I SAM-dependent methyltransferase [Sphingobium lactosutens]
MTLPALRDRACPACGAKTGKDEVACPGDAGTMTVAQLRPYWHGLEKTKHFFPYRRCADCALLYNPVFFDDAQLADLYAAMPPNMDMLPFSAVADTQRGYFAAAARSGPLSGDYLEIGPDIGHLVTEAVAHGGFGRFWLFEPNRAVHDQLKQATGGKPASILTDMTDLSPVPDGSVGLAVLVHVLDHLLDPLTMLRTIGTKLKPGGTLLIVTHDEGSLLRRALGRRWPPFCLQHPLLYNPGTIRRLVARAGFPAIRVVPSTNYFPIDFLVRQGAQAAGFTLPGRLPLPRRAIALRLGNMLTIAQAAA